MGTDQLDNQTVNSAPQRTYSTGLKLDHRNSSDSNRSNYDPPQFGNTQHKGHQERFKPVKSFYIIGIILLYGGLAMALIIPLCYTMNFFETVHSGLECVILTIVSEMTRQGPRTGPDCQTGFKTASCHQFETVLCKENKNRQFFARKMPKTSTFFVNLEYFRFHPSQMLERTLERSTQGSKNLKNSP